LISKDSPSCCISSSFGIIVLQERFCSDFFAKIYHRRDHNNLCFFIMTMTTYSKHFNGAELLLRFRSAVLFNVLGFMVLGTLLVFLVTSSLSKPFGDIIKRLKQIKKGQFDGKIEILSNDEIGYTAEVINDMAEGLKDREFIKNAEFIALGTVGLKGIKNKI